MNRHRVIDYLNQSSLTPSDSQMGAYANTDWWTAASDQFDDILWMYYPERTIFLNNRFPYDPSDPDNAANMQQVIDNIKRTFSIFLKSNAYKYEKLYAAMGLDYNPLYNVDATEMTMRDLHQTGTVEDGKSGKDTVTKSGDDTTEYNGKEDTTRTGNETFEPEGTEATTRSGSETNEPEGVETTVRSGSQDLSHDGFDEKVDANTTYDAATFYDSHKETTTPGVTDTTTFNDVTDEKSFTDRVDTKTYNDVKDEKSFDHRKDTRTYNSVKDEKSFTNRNDKVTYDSSIETSYDSGTEMERDLADHEVIDHRRYGNIGVTSSQNLILQEVDLAADKRLQFYKIIVHDCINMVSYAVE